MTAKKKVARRGRDTIHKLNALERDNKLKEMIEATQREVRDMTTRMEAAILRIEKTRESMFQFLIKCPLCGTPR
jgi:hypothetical protein